MLTSEEEAKGRWCPFTRLPFHLGTEITAVNRHPYEQQQQDTCCRGSGCAAWRWQGWKTTLGVSCAQDPPAEIRDGPRLGYCGLAGEPSPYGPR